MSPKNTILISIFFFLLLNISLSTCQSLSGPFFACQPTDPLTTQLPFCDVSLPISVRVTDLIGRLTLQEKIGLLVHTATSIDRLGIKSYDWAGEALHGVSDAALSPVTFGGEFPGATTFPQVILIAASFNSSLWESIGRVISTEARALYNNGRAGLTYWTPNVNIFRDPRWGRGQETPGEDPFVVSTYAVSHVRGLQVSEVEDRFKVAACCKHYTAYDLEVWNGTDRFHFNALVSKQDLEETYNVPFKACVLEGKVAGIMCSYNQVNGRPTCADPSLLGGTVRGEWKFNGYIVTDCDSLQVVYNRQNYTNTPEEAAALALKSGVDLNCGRFLLNYAEGAIQRGLLSEYDVNRALFNLFTIQMRLGMFDGLKQQYLTLGPEDVCSPLHQQLVLEASQQGIVLLKNRNQALPLSTDRHKTVAVIGPNSNVTATMLGNYAGIPCAITTPLQGISRYANTIYELGCTNVNCTDYRQLYDAAEAASSQADATILVMGIDQSIEAEALDRTSLLLPEFQEEFISRLANASKGPVILVLMSGGPLDVTFAINDENIDAILWAGYPGEAGGTAIADVLFGSINPGGKLPVTWYPEQYVASVPMTDMAMHADPSRGYPGRTYRFYRGPVVFPFGYGLSYTTFQEALLAGQSTIQIPFKGPVSSENIKSLNDSIMVSYTTCDALSLELQIEVENTGKMDGSQTVLVFAAIPSADKTEPAEKQLVSFTKIYVAAGETEKILAKIDVCKHLSVVDQLGIRRIQMGKYIFNIGDHGLEHSIMFFAGIGETKS